MRKISWEVISLALKAPSHYHNWCWLFNNEILWKLHFLGSLSSTCCKARIMCPSNVIQAESPAYITPGPQPIIPHCNIISFYDLGGHQIIQYQTPFPGQGIMQSSHWIGLRGQNGVLTLYELNYFCKKLNIFLHLISFLYTGGVQMIEVLCHWWKAQHSSHIQP